MDLIAQEINFEFEHHNIAAKIWGNERGIPTLAVHGWLDNAASFDFLAPLLPTHYIIAIDLTGHGKSSHKPLGCTLHILDFITDMLPVIQNLKWENFVFLGHSLGAALGSLLAGTYPKMIRALIAIDAMGPMSCPSEHTPHQFSLYLDHCYKEVKPPKCYDSIEQAVQSRLRVNKIKISSCQALVKRGLKQNHEHKWQWRTDPRLLLPSALQLTEAQVTAFLQNILCPTLVLRAQPGFPFPDSIIKQRLSNIRNLSLEYVKGYHHVHMDEPRLIADKIQNFTANFIK